MGESARVLANDLTDGALLLLENVRFNAGETSKDDAERQEFARALALLTGGEDEGGAFVEDAFGAVHRKHASVYDIATLLPHYVGDLVRDELAVLTQLTGEPKRPYVVVLGGSKVSDKLAVIQSLLPKVDRLLGGWRHVLHLPGRPGARGRRFAARARPDRQLPAVPRRGGRQDRPARRHRGRRRAERPTRHRRPFRPTRSRPA